jgi:hypothetical protein
LFEADPGTDAVVIIGELGGTMEEEVAEALKEGTFTNPWSLHGGSTAPKGTKMGHAGAIVTAGKGTVEDKVARPGRCGRARRRPAQRNRRAAPNRAGEGLAPGWNTDAHYIQRRDAGGVVEGGPDKRGDKRLTEASMYTSGKGVARGALGNCDVARSTRSSR